MAGEFGLDITILNSIRNSASAAYQARVPLATRNNIAAIGTIITDYTPLFTEFSGLMGKIALSMVSSKMAINPLSPFKRGLLPVGTDIEDIFVSMAKAEGAYDPTGANALGRRKPDIKFNFYRENRKDKYVTSISQVGLKGACTTEGGIVTLVNEITNSLYSGDVNDEYILAKELLAMYAANYAQYEVAAINSADNAKAFIKAVRKGIADMSFMSASLNKAGVTTRTDPAEQTLIVHKDVLVEVDVEVLSKAFNMGKTDIQCSIIPVDDFGSMTDTYALLVDNGFLMIYDTLYQTADIFNPDGLFTNIFLHHHQILAMSQFKNAIRFTTANLITP